LAEIYDQLDETQLPIVDETMNTRAFFSSADRNLQRTRKVAEVLEDSLDVGFGHSKLTRIAMTGANLSSAVAFVTAAHNLLLTANDLDQAHRTTGSISDIATELFLNFYRAIGIFIAEAILFTSPINYEIAWKGTRVLNNRFLYTLRHSGFSGRLDELLKGLHRLILSESHYAIRGILPSALRAPEEFISYLSSMTKQTLRIVWEFTDIEISEIRSKVESVVDEYHKFAENRYDITAVDVALDDVVRDVVSELTAEIDLLRSQNTGEGIDW